MGRKAGRAGGQSGARRGRDQIPRSAPPPPAKPPQPQHAAASPAREACFFFMVAWPSPLLTLHSSRPLPSNASPAGLCARGFHLCDSSTEAGQPRMPGYRFGQKGPQKAENVGRRRACIVPACCQPQSPTGSRRHVADVLEDKGRHRPHQPPVIDGLCLHGRSNPGTEAFVLLKPSCSPPPAAPNLQVLLQDPQASGPRGWEQAGELEFAGLLALFCFIVFYFSKVSCFEVSPLNEKSQRCGHTDSTEGPLISGRSNPAPSGRILATDSLPVAN